MNQGIGYARRGVDVVKRNGRLVAGGATFVAVTAATRAQATPAFDYTTFSSTLTAGLTVVGTVAAGIASIYAGVVVWRKIARYFGKAG